MEYLLDDFRRQSLLWGSLSNDLSSSPKIEAMARGGSKVEIVQR